MPVVKEAPVLTLSGSHNQLLEHGAHLRQLWDMGVSGINPMPSGIFGAEFAAQMEQIGMGFTRELEFITAARERDMFTFAFAFNAEDAELLTRAGADAISSVPPIYFPVDVKLTFKHYELIAGATDLPFMPYHTGFNNIALPSADEYARLLKELPHFAGVKLTEANFVFFTVLREQLGDDYVLFSGFDEMFMLGVMSGADGAIGTWMNLWGPAFKKVDAEFRKGNIALGKKFTREFMDTAMPLVFEKSNFAPFISHAMRLEYNIDIGPGRGPFYVSDATFADDFVRSTIDRVNAAAEL